jgi:hypothetical protein
MERREAEGLVTGPARKARIVASCAVIAAVAIGLPDAAFLGGFWGYMAVTRAIVFKRNWNPDSEPTDMMVAALLGIAAALYVASVMRRWMGPIVRKRSARPSASSRASIRSLPEQEHERVASR